jgi:hypothetical protein
MLMNPERIVPPTGWAGHIPFVFWLVEELRPGLAVELGTHTGNSYFAICQAAAANHLDARCYAVDTWQGDKHASFYGEEIFQDVSAYNESRYASFSSLMRMTFDEALTRFSDGSIDLLHIDGMHTYEAVKHDFDSWFGKLSPKGVVIMHDISVHDGDFGVWKVWDELKDKFPSFEFRHSYGLGVLFAGAESAGIARALTDEDSESVRNSFAKLSTFRAFVDKTCETALYLDDGSGYSEDKTIRRVSAFGAQPFCLSESFDIPEGIKNIRLDPADSYCVIKNLRIVTEKGNVRYRTNGIKARGFDLFLTNRPQVSLKHVENVKRVSVDGQLYRFENSIPVELLMDVMTSKRNFAQKIISLFKE